jgi:hypothetical protein
LNHTLIFSIISSREKLFLHESWMLVAKTRAFFSSVLATCAEFAGVAAVAVTVAVTAATTAASPVAFLFNTEAKVMFCLPLLVKLVLCFVGKPFVTAAFSSH